MTIMNQALSAVAAGLRGSLHRSQLISHALTMGELREHDVRAAFRPYVPTRFSVSSGIVVNSRGEQSRHQDLLIVDSSTMAPLVESSGMGVHPIESVVAAIEIKSTATRATVSEAVTNGVSVKALLAGAPQPYRSDVLAGQPIRVPAEPGEGCSTSLSRAWCFYEARQAPRRCLSRLSISIARWRKLIVQMR